MKVVEKLKLLKPKKILLSFFFLFIVIILIALYLFYPRLVIKNFKDIEIVEVFDNSYQDNFNVCYGNFIKCKRIDYKLDGTFDISKIGEYQIKYQINYKKVHKTLVKKIIIKDTKSPTLKIADQEFVACPNGKMNNYKYQAIDNYDGDITSKVKYKIKNNKVKYSVKDSSGNETVKEFKIKKQDIDAPTITLFGDTIIYLPLGSSYNESGYQAIDFCDGDLTDSVKIENNVNNQKAGTYEINYQVNDKENNKAIATRKVIIYNNVNDITVPDGKTIYLTFDDGPGPYTDTLLDILKKYNVKATFFIIGNSSQYDNTIQRIYNEGHTLAMHSYTHNYGQIYSSSEGYFNDLNNLKNKIISLTGFSPTIIRFPGGSSNTVSRRYSIGIMSLLTKEVEAQGYRYFDWNITSGDAGETTDTNQVISNVTSALGDNSTYVILQHDIKLFSVNAVESIIQYGLANGYHFAPITSTTPTVHHSVNN